MDFSNTEVHGTDLSARFYTHFQSKKNDITERLDGLKTSNTSSPEFISISADMVALRKDLIDASPYLPTYDRGKCEQQIKVLEESLSSHRAPKSKFAFKRKIQAGSPAPSLTPQVTPVASPIPSNSAPVNPTTNLSLSSKSVAHITLSSLSSNLPSSCDVTLTDIKECIVNFFSNINSTLEITALHAKSLHRDVILIPSIEGSVLLHDIHDCILILGCRQFRIHDSTNVTVLLHVLSNPIIERSQKIRFGSYPEALHHLVPTSFMERCSNHRLAQDFDWIKPTPSPNFVLLDSTPDFVERVVEIVTDGIGDDEVKRVLGEVLDKT